ncbi:MAG: hypothetical protein AAB544_00630 [Patescibacteria group bacterium]
MLNETQERQMSPASEEFLSRLSEMQAARKEAGGAALREFTQQITDRVRHLAAGIPADHEQNQYPNWQQNMLAETAGNLSWMQSERSQIASSVLGEVVTGQEWKLCTERLLQLHAELGVEGHTRVSKREWQLFFRPLIPESFPLVQPQSGAPEEVERLPRFINPLHTIRSAIRATSQEHSEYLDLDSVPLNTHKHAVHFSPRITDGLQGYWSVERNGNYAFDVSHDAMPIVTETGDLSLYGTDERTVTQFKGGQAFDGDLWMQSVGDEPVLGVGAPNLFLPRNSYDSDLEEFWKLQTAEDKSMAWSMPLGSRY